jgi:lysophospholipase L1-like esterase
MMKILCATLVAAACAGPGSSIAATSITRIDSAPQLAPLPISVAGRVVSGDAGYRYQWPGLYFESAFEGRGVYMKIGPGKVILHVIVDGKALGRLVKPAAGIYLIDGLGDGKHTVRVNIATESQSGANVFGGFAATQGRPQTAPMPPKRARQIEFIGDSHTVGYGNTSLKRECSEEEVWQTTDNTQAYGPITARRYHADYRVTAISGRGIVRNYDGAPGDQLPDAYPYALFDHSARDNDTRWQPQIIVIALGTNDFSTALNPGERWTNRQQLHNEYEAGYVSFVQDLRARHPRAHFVLWATDGAGGEIQSEVNKVVDRLRETGETRVSFIPVNGLEMTGCHWHPSVEDDRTISEALSKLIDAQPALWQGQPSGSR